MYPKKTKLPGRGQKDLKEKTMPHDVEIRNRILAYMESAWGKSQRGDRMTAGAGRRITTMPRARFLAPNFFFFFFKPRIFGGQCLLSGGSGWSQVFRNYLGRQWCAVVSPPQTRFFRKPASGSMEFLSSCLQSLHSQTVLGPQRAKGCGSCIAGFTMSCVLFPR